jgi:hypothetical protein
MKLLKALLLVFIAFSAFSQKNYTKGFIILKNQTDTLKGLIDDQNWAVNPRTINFINAENLEQSYDISHLEAFGVQEKENYLVAKADLDITPVLKMNLLSDRNILVKKDTLLAFMVLLKADYSLLYVRDHTYKEHFFYKDGEKIIELINHFFLETIKETTHELNNKLYQKQLESLFNHCEKKIETNNLIYQIDALTQKFVEFSECIGCNYTCYYKKKKDRAIFTFGVMAGYTSDKNDLSHFGMSSNFQIEMSSPNILVGANASISSRRNRQKNSFVFESYITRETAKSEQNNFSANIYYLSLSPRIRHQFISRHKLKMFIGGGFNAKCFVSYPGMIRVNGAKVNILYTVEAGLKWNNFLLSVNVRARTNSLPNPLFVYYKVRNSDWMENTIQPDQFNFQFSLTYLRYNSGNKAKTK